MKWILGVFFWRFLQGVVWVMLVILMWFGGSIGQFDV